MFLIWVGEYSGKDVIAISEDKKIAEAYAKLHNGYVTEAPVISDKNYIQRANEMLCEWKFGFSLDDSGIRLHTTSYKYVEPSEKKDIEEGMFTWIYVYDEDKDKALKIAWDRAYKIQAERLGL